MPVERERERERAVDTACACVDVLHNIADGQCEDDQLSSLVSRLQAHRRFQVTTMITQSYLRCSTPMRVSENVTTRHYLASNGSCLPRCTDGLSEIKN